MKLQKLTINNFKIFENIEVTFHEGFNLLLGDNGVGKTTILEAAAAAMGGFLAGMEDVATRNIYVGDIRYHIEKDSNGIPNKSYHYPVEVSCDLQYGDLPYSWTRQKNSPEGKTTTNPKEIYQVSRNMVNGISKEDMWPVLSYQSASRNWVSRRSDAGKKLRKQLHDRRCGYLGCLDAIADLNSVYEWCYQMEWLFLQNHVRPEAYNEFIYIISLFMSKMNGGTRSEVVFHPTLKKLMYLEDGEYMHIEDLSAGYQSILRMVIDLAYRMALLNPDAGKKIRMAEGIVLIDEIDTNLHPKWQWRIVDALVETFPNVQFIAATHSPMIVSSCKNANIICINGNDDVKYLSDVYAYTVDEILRGMLGKYIRPEKVDRLISEFQDCMDVEDYNKAKLILEETKKVLGEEHPDVICMQSEYHLEAE